MTGRQRAVCLPATAAFGITRMMQTVSPPDQPARAHWPWIPWVVTVAFAGLACVLLGITGSLRQRAGELTQQLGDTERALADLQSEQSLLERKLVKVETNYGSRIADLQKQIVQKNQEFQ